MINFTDEIDDLTTAQALYALAFIVGRVETTGQATPEDVRQAIENARSQA